MKKSILIIAVMLFSVASFATLPDFNRSVKYGEAPKGDPATGGVDINPTGTFELQADAYATGNSTPPPAYCSITIWVGATAKQTAYTYSYNGIPSTSGRKFWTGTITRYTYNLNVSADNPGDYSWASVHLDW